MKPNPLIAALCASSLLAACADTGGIVPHRKPVDVASLDGGKVLTSGLSEAGWPQERWWTMFGDAQLDALVAHSVADNPSLKLAMDRIEQARASAEGAESVIGWDEDIEALSRRTHYSANHIFPAPLGGGSFWENQANLKLSYAFDFWGGDRAAWDAALGGERASELEARAARLALESAVVRAYVNYALACELHHELEAEVEQRQQIIDITLKLRAAGMVAELQLSQVKAQLPLLKARLDASESAIERARYALAALAGDGPGAGESLKAPELALDRPIELPQAAPAMLIGRRPDVVARRWRVEAASRGIDAMHARFYPNVDLHALIGLQTLSFNKFLLADSAAWEVGPAVSLPIFRGDELRAQLRGQTAAFDSAVDAYDASVIAALHEAADALSERRSAEAQTQDTHEAVEAAQRAYDQAHAGFKAGLTGYLDVLQAQTALFTAREALVRSSAQRLASQATLMQALGGGFDPNADEPDSSVAKHADAPTQTTRNGSAS